MYLFSHSSMIRWWKFAQI